MRVAIISKPGRGKTVFASLLGGCFARTHRKNITILSTGVADDYTSYNECAENTDPMQSVAIMKVAAEAGRFSTPEGFDYGVRLGEDNVFLYDVHSSVLEDADAEDLVIKIMKDSTARLTLVEVQGDINSPYNQRVLETADAIFYMFSQTMADISGVKHYLTDKDINLRGKTGFVCSQFDGAICSEKRLGDLLGITTQNIMIFPFNERVRYAVFKENLDALVKGICQGHEGVVELRSRMQECLQWLFDKRNYKYIKPLTDWR